MQTTIVGRTAKDISRPHRGRGGIQSFRRPAGRAKNHSRQGIHRTGFLNQQLPCIPANSGMYATFLNEYLTEENFDFLAECAIHYAGLLEKNLILPSGNTNEKICLLYHLFAGILPDGQELNIEIIEERLRWVIYHSHNWDDHTFFWMPLKFITLLSGQIKEIAMSFMHLFIRENGLTRFRHGYEFDFFFEYLIEVTGVDNYDESDRGSLQKLVESYLNGEISVFLDEIYDHVPVDVVKALEEYQPSHPLEKELINCFRNGLPFISGENSIMNYNYDGYSEYIPEYGEDFPPVTLDRIIRYIYELGDFISRELEATNNEHLQETYAQEPASFMILYPDSELFMYDDYPERFAEWFLAMMDVTKKITGHE